MFKKICEIIIKKYPNLSKEKIFDFTRYIYNSLESKIKNNYPSLYKFYNFFSSNKRLILSIVKYFMLISIILYGLAFGFTFLAVKYNNFFFIFCSKFFFWIYNHWTYPIIKYRYLIKYFYMMPYVIWKLFCEILKSLIEIDKTGEMRNECMNEKIPYPTKSYKKGELVETKKEMLEEEKMNENFPTNSTDWELNCINNKTSVIQETIKSSFDTKQTLQMIAEAMDMNEALEAREAINKLINSPIKYYETLNNIDENYPCPSSYDYNKEFKKK